MRANRTCGEALTRAMLAGVVATGFLCAAAAPASAELVDTFVTTGNAQARWVDEPGPPANATDTQSIELAVRANSATDFNDAAWVTFKGFAGVPPATPPRFLYKVPQAGPGGGSVRLVIRFNDGGLGFLRPQSLLAGTWVPADGSSRNWESSGGLACGPVLSYAEMLACHPGASVTSLEVINDSGWLHSGRFSALVDNVSYGGELVTKAARPLLGRTVNAAIVTGRVTVRLPGGGAEKYDRVDGIVQSLPVGTTVDARRGTVRLIARRGKGRKKFQSGKFSGSVFVVGQRRRGKNRGLTTLGLQKSSRKRCSARSASAGGPRAGTAARRKGLLRRLKGNAKGRFRTRGRYSSAIVRGTTWEISDRCEGTLVKVQKGTVAVRDFGLRRTIVVHSGESYLARAPGY